MTEEEIAAIEALLDAPDDDKRISEFRRRFAYLRKQDESDQSLLSMPCRQEVAQRRLSPGQYNTQSDFAIRLTHRGDVAACRPLWVEYLRSSGVDIPLSAIDATLRRIATPDGAMKALLATEVASGNAIGFAVFVLHPYTFGEGAACLVDDLYVDPNARGRGIAKALLSELIRLADAEGWSKVYWVADKDNLIARRLFDRHFAQSDGFVRYTITRNGVGPRAVIGVSMTSPDGPP